MATHIQMRTIKGESAVIDSCSKEHDIKPTSLGLCNGTKDRIRYFVSFLVMPITSTLQVLQQRPLIHIQKNMRLNMQVILPD